VWLSFALIEACGFPRANVFPLTTECSDIAMMQPSEGPPLGKEFWDWFARQAQPPTRDNLLKRLQWLKTKVKPGDLVLIYFSGHGMFFEGKCYLATMETDNSSARAVTETAIAAEELTAALNALPVRSVVLIFDACRNDPFGGGKPIMASSKSAFIADTLGDALSRSITVVPRERGEMEMAATLFSCKVGQQSYEWAEKKHGFFTYFLTRGLLGAAAEASGKVTLNSLESYLAREVAPAVEKLAGRDQVPWLKREGTDPGSLILSWAGLISSSAPLPSATGAPAAGGKTVCVHNFVNLTRQPATEYLGAALAEGIASQLANAPGVQVVERSQLNQVMHELRLQETGLVDEKTSLRLGKLLGAEFSLVGSFEIATSLKLNVRLVANQTGKVLCGLSRSSSNRRYLEANVAFEVARCLGSSLPEPEIPTESSPFPLTTSAEDEALKLFDARDYAGAFHAYCRASDADLNNADLHRRIEKCALLGRLQQRFLERYLRLVEQYPENAVLRNYLGNAYLMLDPKDTDGKARQQYEQALRLDPTFAPPLNNLGIITFRQGEAEQAESRFKEYLARCPQDASGWVNLGLLYVKRVEQDRSDSQAATLAAEALQKAIQLQPGLASAYKALGRLYAATSRKLEALSAYERSLSLNYDQPEVRQQVELLRWEAGSALASTLAASDEMETRGRPSPVAPLTIRIAESLALKNYPEAEALAQELCRLAPGDPLAWQLLGRAYQQQGKNAPAAKAFEEAKRLSR